MTPKQRMLRFFYPLLMKLKWKNDIRTSSASPHVSFYDLESELNSGGMLQMSDFKNKKILIVNTASDCGFTKQYEALQQLSEKYKNDLVIIAFPSNDFKEQEKLTDDDIAAFCKINYGVRFPIMKKSVVKNGATQHAVFKWLCNKENNGWNDNEPVWNFTKYLINEKGALAGVLGPGVSPMDKILEDFLGIPGQAT